MNDDPNGRLHHLRPLAEAPPPPSLPRQPNRGRGPRAIPTSDRLSDANGGAPLEAVSAAITRAIVGLLRARTGRGPRRAKTAMSSGLAIVTLGDCLTRAERTLAREGQGALALQLRAALHKGMRTEAVAAVEAITGRDVVAYLTDEYHDPDLAIIAFVFGPRP